MLGQEIVKNLIINSKDQVKKDHLSKLKDEWEGSLHDIRHSIDIGDINFKNKDKTFLKLFQLAKNNQKKVLGWSREEQSLEQLLSYDLKFKDSMNKLVYYLQDITNKKIHNLRLFEIFIFIFSFIILFCEYFFLYKKTKGNFKTLFSRFTRENQLSSFFLSSEEHFFAVVNSENKVIDCNNSWLNSDLPKQGEFNKFIPILIKAKNHQTKVTSKKNGVRVIKWNSKPTENQNFYVWGYDITNQEIANNKILHHNKISYLGKASAGLAHEIKNPLTYIKSNLEIIDLQRKNNITYTEDVINSIREGVERINQLTDDFRIRSSENLNDSILHQRPSQEKPINLCEYVNKSLRMTLITSTKNIQVNNQICNDVHITFPPEKLVQCLVNIFQNSIESFALKKENRHIEISSNEKNGKIQIMISDNGGGIKESELAEIFEPFTSFGRNKKNNSGIGLHICREIITSNGGSIQAFQDKEYFNIVIELLRKVAPIPPKGNLHQISF